jgi:hypothetical protein
MALKFDKYIFYHIPKTGGTYFRAVIAQSFGNREELGHTHNTPLEVPNHKKYTSITIVRNPLDWYKSFFRYRTVSNWRKGHFIDKHAKAKNFNKFMENMLYAYPCGYVTSRYLSVIPFVNKIFRTETLDADIQKFFKEIGKEVPKAERKNVTPQTIDTSLAPDTHKKYLRAESRIISYLNY